MLHLKVVLLNLVDKLLDHRVRLLDHGQDCLRRLLRLLLFLLTLLLNCGLSHLDLLLLGLITLLLRAFDLLQLVGDPANLGLDLAERAPLLDHLLAHLG